jgi:excisionase family DNA binding protein
MQRAELGRTKATSGAKGGNAACTKRSQSGRGLTPRQADLIRRNPPLIMSAVEAAVYTDTSERNFRELAERGVFPSVRIGRRVLFRRKAIDAALAQLEEKKTPHRRQDGSNYETKK